MEQQQYRILGQGISGVVIHPSIGCSEKTRTNPELFITKILSKTEAQKEKNAFDKLPDTLDNTLYYKFCEICDDEGEMLRNVVEQLKLDKKFLNYAILNSRYIEGSELESIFQTYKNEDNQTNTWNNNYELSETIPVISKELFINIIELLKKLYDNIVILNESGFYHNDISSTNIIINKDLNHIYLIDFTFSGNKPNFNNPNTDKNGCINTIKMFIDMGTYNPEIKDIIDKAMAIATNKKIDIAFIDTLLGLLHSKNGGQRKKRTRITKTSKNKTKRTRKSRKSRKTRKQSIKKVKTRK